jgi:[ribosomal protein S5]-alanine N-acetyltransferase
MKADADSPPSPNPPLQGTHLRLQPLGAEHAEALFPVLADPTLYVHLDHGPPASAARLAEVYRQLEARRSPDGQEYWLNWAVFALQPTTPMGFVQASVLADGRAWVAYVLGTAHQGKGHAGEALGLMLEHLFQALGVHQAMATVERENARSIALLKRQGFSLATGDALHGHDLTESEQLWLRGPS